MQRGKKRKKISGELSFSSDSASSSEQVSFKSHILHLKFHKFLSSGISDHCGGPEEGRPLPRLLDYPFSPQCCEPVTQCSPNI